MISGFDFGSGGADESCPQVTPDSAKVIKDAGTGQPTSVGATAPDSAAGAGTEDEDEGRARIEGQAKACTTNEFPPMGRPVNVAVWHDLVLQEVLAEGQKALFRCERCGLGNFVMRLEGYKWPAKGYECGIEMRWRLPAVARFVVPCHGPVKELQAFHFYSQSVGGNDHGLHGSKEEE